MYNRTKTVYTAFYFFVFYIESLESPKMTSVRTISEFCGIQLREFWLLKKEKDISETLILDIIVRLSVAVF